MTVIEVARPRTSSGATRPARSLLLEPSSARIHPIDFDGSYREGDEPGEHPVQAVHVLVPEGNSDLRPKLRLVIGGPANAATQGTYLRGGLPPHVLRRVRKHIDNNFGQRIKIETLARLANLSIWYFLRAFKQSVGITPHTYLIRRRIERTMKLLLGSDMPLSQIAL